ncbi:hypothetical protein NBH00_16820 [Paraconexibacter antarcticus]|uniref:Phosphoesterase family protein n=1 Tax=Paraconexibacter antarcticus TaxID=2949664 RepID=A0ABY5DQ52_9ACTN|nr:hypothetical protein [Paraconexibacter antarcticus]UTI63016.1 hypothetical protein NBH00_16820 [Paraconexibacter antarcticus]
MTSPSPPSASGPPACTCDECGTPAVPGQHYCTICGTRLAPTPEPEPEPGGGTAPDAAAAAAGDGRAQPAPFGFAMPGPRAAAVAVMGVLGFGVVLGSVASPSADSASRRRVLVAVAPRPATAITASVPAAPPAPTPAPAVPDVPAPLPVADAPVADAAPATATPTPTPTPSPSATPATVDDSATAPDGPSLPPVKHVFVVMLSQQEDAGAFGPASPSKELGALVKQGEVLPNYYAVAQGELANEIALVSGQGPTVQTTADCPQYTDITPATIDDKTGQVSGAGCVYPAKAQTLADQLAADGRTWKAYVEGVDTPPAAAAPQDPASAAPAAPAPLVAATPTTLATPAPATTAPGSPTVATSPPAGLRAATGTGPTCRHPQAGTPDTEGVPRPGDPYVTWRNPFVYFHSVIDAPACAAQIAGLDALDHDLAAEKDTPAVSYIVPDRCHDGSPQPCATGAPAGLAAADPFLRTTVTRIMRSPAYRAGGLIAITFAQAPQRGEHADPSSCCVAPLYPNLPAPGTTPADPPPAAPGTPADAPGPATGAATSAPAAAAPPAGTTATTAPTTPAVPADPTSSPGGGKVGLLLLSPYVKAGSQNVVGSYNHYSLLGSIEDLFDLAHLGYAKDAALPTFDSAVYNAPAKTG